jgi:hypothetical protein
MATTITCDRCDAAITESRLYILILHQVVGNLNAEKVDVEPIMNLTKPKDLCPNCVDQIKRTVQRLIEPEPKADNGPG